MSDPSPHTTILEMDIRTLLAETEKNLQELPTLLLELRPLLEQGITLGELRNIDHADLNQRYKVAYDLFQKEDYQQALPILLYLLAHNPSDLRFPFAAGMCFQQVHPTNQCSFAVRAGIASEPRGCRKCISHG